MCVLAPQDDLFYCTDISDGSLISKDTVNASDSEPYLFTGEGGGCNKTMRQWGYQGPFWTYDGLHKKSTKNIVPCMGTFRVTRVLHNKVRWYQGRFCYDPSTGMLRMYACVCDNEGGGAIHYEHRTPSNQRSTSICCTPTYCEPPIIIEARKRASYCSFDIILRRF